MAANRGNWWDGICFGWGLWNAAHRGVICTSVSTTEFLPFPLFSDCEFVHSRKVYHRLATSLNLQFCPWRWRQNLHVDLRSRSRSGRVSESFNVLVLHLFINPLLAFHEQNKPLYCARPHFVCSFTRHRKKAGWKSDLASCILSHCKEHKLGRNHSCSAPDCHKSSLACSLFAAHIHRQLWITVKSLQVQHFSRLKKAQNIGGGKLKKKNVSSTLIHTERN